MSESSTTTAPAVSPTLAAAITRATTACADFERDTDKATDFGSPEVPWASHAIGLDMALRSLLTELGRLPR